MSDLTSEPTPAPFITFYSFKGGVGRSMALINVAGILASRGFRVLVIDLDLEAPGLSYLVTRDAPPSQPPLRLGVVDLLQDAVSRGPESDLFALSAESVVDKYTGRYPLPDDRLKRPGGCLAIMPAGTDNGDDSYQRRLEFLDLPGLYREGAGQDLIAIFKKTIQEANRFDFVFVDSRTGFSDESGICTRDLADHVVVVTGLNHQNVTGTANFLRALRLATDGNRQLQFVVSPVPQGEDELVDQREQAARRAFEQAWTKPVDLSVQIPYHPRLALTEEPHIFRRSRGYLYDAYVALERALLSSIQLTAAALAREANTAVEAKQYPLALTKLRTAIRLEDGPNELLKLSTTWLSAANAPRLSRKRAALPPQAKWYTEESAQPLLRFLAKELPSDASKPLHQWAYLLHDEQLAIAGDFYQRALEVSPEDAVVAGDFAVFQSNVQGNHDAAEQLYRQAVAADPLRSPHLTNFALFLTSVRHDYDQVEQLYLRALAADPDHANNLGNYASFLADIRNNTDQAEQFFQRALTADPDHANSLSNYALFLAQVRSNSARAEQLYLRALRKEPADADNLGNYAQLLFELGRDDEGRARLRQAFQTRPTRGSIVCELWFYAYAHAWREWPDALSQLKRALQGGARSKGWPLARNVARAKEQGHPAPDLVAALAEVIAHESPLATLDSYPAWGAAAPDHPDKQRP